MQNYLRKKEQKEQREKDLREGLKLYKTSKYKEALEKFESVLGSKPDPTEASIQAGLSGIEDFKRIMTDPDLANIRTSEEFEPLMKRFDESFINKNATHAIKSIFGIFNKN
ncbi:protein containing PDZ domain, a K-box domain, and a TPR region [Actinidia rufa]|uniref:Protein containing PDZ domain, a K-box domain, and a TPR region n=1 Tax=Actinidia rufa TaxID=165716 RepID=A0A7J0H558_9ERIC|nr:protein containing PDZ domain, a K-box domain, and a TPR region [Actinidia rufa]